MSARSEKRVPRAIERGSTILEAVIAVAVVAIALLTAHLQTALGYGHNEANARRVTAYRTALTILAEVQAAIDVGRISHAGALEELDDGSMYNPSLTTLGEHWSPGLGLQEGDGEWSRILEVAPTQGQPFARFVKVTVFHRQAGREWQPQASVARVMTVPPKPETPIQTYDVYILAPAEVPSLWQPMGTARSLIEQAAQELEGAASGLDLRLHWIDKLGYGRDPLYVPYVNTTDPATSDIDSVYWYPGRLGDGSDLFDHERFTGRIRTESGIHNDYEESTLPYPHAVADQWNHCLRLPQARRLFEQRVAAGLEKEDEPPLQILLADLDQDPERFRNAIFVNLCGKGIPMPPMRNYSDAAKDPSGRPGVRAVTHPLRLWTPRDPNGDGDNEDSQGAEFRVYAYKTDPREGDAVLEEPITVQIMGLDLSQSLGPLGLLDVRRLPGGIDTDTGREDDDEEYRSFDSGRGIAPRGAADADDPYEMYYEVGYESGPEPYTWIKLYNTPLVAPEEDDRGLDDDYWLHGMEYIPSPVGRGSKPIDLYEDDDDTPKNTARWRIRISKRAFSEGVVPWLDQVVTVKTRIGDDMTTGSLWPVPNEPRNLSVTYTWWTESHLSVPLPERYQFLGDPRYNPYMDLTRDGDSFPNGYNSLGLGTPDGDTFDDWRCLDPNRFEDTPSAGVYPDISRFFEIYRDGLEQSMGVLAGPEGVSDTLLLGGEIALPPSEAPDPTSPTPVLLEGTAFGRSSTVLVDSTGLRSHGSGELFGIQVIRNSDGDAFRGSPSTGELSPDRAWADWTATGNLATTSFHREVLNSGNGVAGADVLPLATGYPGQERAEGEEISPAGTLLLMGVKPGERDGDLVRAMAVHLSGLRDLFAAGHPDVEVRITQVPRLQIRDPLPHSKLNGAAGVVTWRTSFERFDGKPYAPDFPPEFGEPETDLAYAVYYSLDEGKTWYSAIDGEPRDPGERPDSSGLLWDTMTGDESFAVNFGDHEIPNGDLLLRVVCHDYTRILHSSHHQVQVTVQ